MSSGFLKHWDLLLYEPHVLPNVHQPGVIIGIGHGWMNLGKNVLIPIAVVCVVILSLKTVKAASYLINRKINKKKYWHLNYKKV